MGTRHTPRGHSHLPNTSSRRRSTRTSASNSIGAHAHALASTNTSFDATVVEQVQSLFPDAASLHRTKEWRAIFQSRLAAVNSQLDGNAQAQVDEMELAVRLLREAKQEMIRLERGLEVMDERCADALSVPPHRSENQQGQSSDPTRVLLSSQSSEPYGSVNDAHGDNGSKSDESEERGLNAREFACIRALSCARINIESVRDDLNAYTALPAQVAALKYQLESTNDATTLRGVFVEWQVLDRWQQETLLEVAAAMNAARQQEEEADNNEEDGMMGIQSNTNNNRGEMNTIKSLGGRNSTAANWGASVEAQERTLVILGGHFDRVRELGDVLWGMVWMRIRRCLTLAQANPVELVAAVELVVRADTEFSQYQKDAQEPGAHPRPESVARMAPPNQTRRCKDVLKEAAKARLDSKVPVAAAAQASVDKLVKVATSLLLDFEVVKQEVAACFPPDIKVFEIFCECYDKRFVTIFTPLLERASTLDGGDILSLAGWLDGYVEHMSDLGVNEQMCERWRRLSTNVMTQYLDKAQPRLTQWLDNIMERDNSPESRRSGALVTAVPEDLFTLVSHDLEAVVRQVSGRHLARFVSDGLYRLIRDYKDRTIAPLGPSSGIFVLCAVVNDFERLQENAEGLAMRCEGSVAESDSREELDEATHKLVFSLGKGAGVALAYIVDVVMFDLDPVFNDSMFCDSWVREGADRSSASIICATLEEYFEHSQEGLNNTLASIHHSGKAVAMTLQRVINMYVCCFLDQSKPYDDASLVASRIRNDAAEFQTFFGRYENALVYGGVHSIEALQEQIAVIGLLADFLESRAPQLLFERMSTEFGDHVSLVCRRLLVLSGNHSDEYMEQLMGTISSPEYDVDNHNNSQESGGVGSRSTDRFSLEFMVSEQSFKQVRQFQKAAMMELRGTDGSAVKAKRSLLSSVFKRKVNAG